MAIYSQVLIELMAAGLGGEMLVAAMARIEAAGNSSGSNHNSSGKDPRAEKIRAYDRQRKAAKKAASASEPKPEIPAETDDGGTIGGNLPDSFKQDSGKEDSGIVVTREAKVDKRGTRLPEDWQPTVEHWTRAEELAFDRNRFDLAVEEFKNFWWSKPGAHGRKLDWSRTFINRLIELAGRYQQRKPTNGNGTFAENFRGALQLRRKPGERGIDGDRDDLFQLPRLQQNP